MDQILQDNTRIDTKGKSVLRDQKLLKWTQYNTLFKYESIK